MTKQNSSDQIFTINTDGWSLGAGNTGVRTLSITGGDATISTSGVNTFTTPASTSTLASLQLAETFSALKTFSAGLTVSVGTVTITPLNIAGIVHNNSSGILSTSLIVSGDITANSITNSLIRQSAANTIVGNPTGSAANVTDITLGSTLTFSSGALQTTALSGDVTTSANSFVTTIANNAVSNAKFRQSAGLSVVGNAGTSTANVADITGTTDQVLRVNSAGTALGFGAINLASASAVTGALTVTNGGTGRATLTTHGVLVGAGTGAITQLAAAVAGTLLAGQGTGSDPSFSSTPTLGIAGTTLGTLSLAGNTSGTITIQPQAAAGTYNFNLPTTAGTSGQVLTSAGGVGAAMTWTTPAVGTVTSVATGSGLTGGTITTTGTIAVATNGITNSLFRQSAGLSVVGNSGTGAANVADITGIANQVLIVNAAGTSLAFGALNLASSSAVTGVLPVANGGTGQSTLTNHGVLIGAGTTAITQLAAAPAGTVLTGQGAADPSFSATPTLGVAGTTLGSLLLAGNTSGTITIKSQAAAGTYNFNLPTTAGTAGQVLTSQGGAGSAMTWTSAGSGTVTSVTFTGDGTLLSSTPSAAVTTSGTLTAALANAGGGTVLGRAAGTTGAPSYTISPVLGIAATSTGTLGFANGSASGDTVTIQNNSATAGAYNFNLPATVGTTGQVLTSQGGAGSAMTWTTLNNNNFGSYVYYASNFENPNNANWTINALAYATVDATNNAFVIRAFNDTTETGTGFYLTPPTGSTNMVFTWKVRPATAPGATNNKIVMRLYSRHIPGNAAISAWSSATNFTQWTIPNNANYQYFTQTVTLATLGLTAGDLYAFELTRQASITNNVAGLLYLIEFTVTFT